MRRMQVWVLVRLSMLPQYLPKPGKRDFFCMTWRQCQQGSGHLHVGTSATRRLHLRFVVVACILSNFSRKYWQVLDVQCILCKRPAEAAANRSSVGMGLRKPRESRHCRLLQLCSRKPYRDRLGRHVGCLPSAGYHSLPASHLKNCEWTLI